MAISFNELPDDLKKPGSFMEIKPASISGSGGTKNIIIFGHKLAVGTAEENKEYPINSLSEAESYFGKGSQLYEAIRAFKTINATQNCYAVAVPDGSGAVLANAEKEVEKVEGKEVKEEKEEKKKSTKEAEKEQSTPKATPQVATSAPMTFTATLAGNASTDKQVRINIAGRIVKVLAIAGDTASIIASKIVNAVLADSEMLVVASIDTTIPEKMIFTAKNSGIIGNDIQLTALDTLSGITATDVVRTDGIGTPDFATTLSLLNKAFHYHYFISPFTDADSMKALEDELASRYLASRQIGARAFICYSGSDITALKTFGNSRNSPHVCCLGIMPSLTYQMPHMWSATIAGALTPLLANDPSQGLSQILLKNLVVSNHISETDRNNLLNNGIATWKQGADTLCYLERPITMYQMTSSGEDDESWLDIQVPETLDARREKINAEINSQYITKGYKLATDGGTYSGGSKVITPKIFTGFLLDLEKRVFINQNAWCQNYDYYKSVLRVEIDPSNKNRINYYEEPTLVGQFYIAVGSTNFR